MATRSIRLTANSVACGGFTLIEVMVALAIVAVALSAGIKASGALVASTQRQSEVLLAQICAENELTRLRLLRVLPGVGDSSFTCVQAGRIMGGTLSVLPTPNPNFRRADARVRDAESSDAPLVYRLTTVIGRY